MMLPVSRGIPPPSIVGYYENKIRSLFDIICNIFPKDGFPADYRGNSGTVIAGIKVFAEFLDAMVAKSASQVKHKLSKESQVSGIGHFFNPCDQFGFDVRR